MNGPILDGMSFVTGLKSGRYLIRQRKTRRPAGAQVPRRHDPARNRGDAREPVSGARRGGRFQDAVAAAAAVPRRATASSSITSISTSDELWRKGRAVGAVIDGRLYLILLDAARSHYYGATLPDFEAIVASAAAAAAT